MNSLNQSDEDNLNLELLKQGADVFCSLKCSILNYLNDNFTTNNNENLKLINIAKFIENKLKTEIKYDTSRPLDASIAFPIGLNVNQVIAHWSPNHLDTKQVLRKDDIIKIDYGVQLRGYIIDSAFSYSHNNKFNQLIQISEEATNKGCAMIGEDVLINDISETIQEIIESSEIELDGKQIQVKSTKNLTGHKIQKYKIHGDKMIPNISIPQYKERIKDNELYAIETYPTTGNGLGVLSNNPSEISHYMLDYKLKDKPVSLFTNLNKKERELLKIIKNKFGTLPFARRWLNEMNLKKYYLNLKSLVNKNIIIEFPPYYDIKGSYVSQTEKNVIIKNGIKTILT